MAIPWTFSWTPKTDNQDPILAEDPNTLADGIIEVEDAVSDLDDTMIDTIKSVSKIKKDVDEVAESIPEFATAQEIEKVWSEPVVTLNGEYYENNFVMLVTQSEIEKLQDINIGSEFLLKVNAEGNEEEFSIISTDPNAGKVTEYNLSDLVPFHIGLNTYQCKMTSHYDQFLPGEIEVISY